MNSIVTPPADHAPPRVGEIPSVRGPLASLSLSMLLSSLSTSIANVALPTLEEAFRASFAEVQWVVLAYLLAITTTIVGAGRLGDLIGRRRLLLIGLFVFTASSGLCGFASTLGELIGARAAQGLGAAVMMALTLAFVGETVPKEKTGRAMGLLGTMSAIGTALGPALGGIVIAGFGWPAIFFVSVPLGCLALLLAYRYLPREHAQAERDRVAFDHAGTLMLALTLASYALAMTLGHGPFDSLNVMLLAVSAIGAALFLRIEARANAPLIRLSMFRVPSLSAGLATSAIVSTVMMATLVVGPFYLSRALGLDAARVGLAVSVGPIVVALSGLPAGRIADRFGASRATLAGLVAIAGGCTLLALLPTTLGVLGYVVPIAVVTAGYAFFQTANNAGVMADVPPDRRGVVSGLLNLSRNLGLITGASAMGAVFSVASRGVDVTATGPQANANGMRITFAVAVGLTVAALIVAAASRTFRSGARRNEIR
jgi:EmrB/QacA subfamily drug resistance transporter